MADLKPKSCTIQLRSGTKWIVTTATWRGWYHNCGWHFHRSRSKDCGGWTHTLAEAVASIVKNETERAHVLDLIQKAIPAWHEFDD